MRAFYIAATLALSASAAIAEPAPKVKLNQPYQVTIQPDGRITITGTVVAEQIGQPLCGFGGQFSATIKDTTLKEGPDQLPAKIAETIQAQIDCLKDVKEQVEKIKP